MYRIFSTVEDVQYSVEIPSVLWRIFNSVEGNQKYCLDGTKSAFSSLVCPSTIKNILHYTELYPSTLLMVSSTVLSFLQCSDSIHPSDEILP